MPQEVKVGLKKAYYAIMTQDNEGALVYSAPVAFAGIQQIGVTPRVSSIDIPGDDDYENISETMGADISIQKKYLSSNETAILYGKAKIGNMVVGGDTDNPPYLAFGYMRSLKNGSGLYVWILKMKFADSASTADTKQPDAISPQYDTLSGRSQKRLADKCWIFQEESSDPDFPSTWFTKAKLETFGNTASTVYGQPAEVSSVAALPGTGTAGVVYHLTTDDSFHYWNGTAFVEI